MIAIEYFVEVINTHIPPCGIEGLELVHIIDGQREKWNEYKNNSSFNHPQSAKYVHPPPPLSNQLPLESWDDEGKETKTRLELGWAHCQDAPNRCQGGNNAILQPHILNSRQCEDLICVGGAPIVSKIVGGDSGWVKKHHIESNVGQMWFNTMIRGSIGQWRQECIFWHDSNFVGLCFF
jgi:hypothetical protein